MNGSSGISNSSTTADGAQGHGVAGDSIVLEEEIDPNYVPTQDEVREYAKWLGMELEDDRNLFWIAKEGLKAPLPENWKPCKTVDTEEIYYFNFATGESTWDHPCDEYYRKLYEEEKKKKLTKDKAKHDKSKQQAKKDVNQLLGRDKKKKGRPTRKPAMHQPSPESVQVVPSPASSILDRKPLPGIGRKPLQGGDKVEGQATTSPPPPSENTKLLSDRPPSRTQPNNLVGHRLSQHLSVSAESDDANQISDDDKFVDRVTKLSDSKAQLREGDVDILKHRIDSATHSTKADHAAALKELRAKHGRELDRLEQAHNDAKDQLEDGHRRHVTSKKRQWATTAEAEAEAARAALKSDMERTRASHSHEITKLEDILKDTKAQLKQAVAETEEAKEAAKAEAHDLESTLTGLRRRVVDGKRSLQEAQQAARKVAEAQVLQEDEKLRLEMMRVVADLEDERKHVAELEGQLKEAKNGTKTPKVQAKDGSSQATALVSDIRDSGAVAKVALLEDELALIVRENENLRSQVSRVGDQRGDACMPASLAEGPKLEIKEIASLKRDLEEAEIRLLEIQQAKNLAEQDAKGSAAALADIQEKLAGFELDSLHLVKQAVYGGGASDMLLDAGKTGDKLTPDCVEVEKEQDGFVRRHDTDHFSVNLQAEEVARYAGELKASNELETAVRNELQAVQLALHESQIKNAELNASLTTAYDEKTRSAATEEQLRLEIARLKVNVDRLCSAAEGCSSKDVSDTLVDEVKELRLQLAAVTNDRERLNNEVGGLKQQRISCEGVQQAEQAMFQASLARQQRRVESLQITVGRLELEVLASKRREEELHASVKTLREHIAASKLEIWRLEEQLRETSAEARRGTDDKTLAKQEQTQQITQKDESEADTVSAADLEQALAATDQAVREARDLAAKNSALASRLQFADEEVDRLQGSLQDTLSKLADVQSVAASAKLSSDHALSNLASSKEELAEARKSGQDAVQQLAEAHSRCLNAEELVTKAHEAKEMLKHNLKEAVRVRDAQTKELCAARDRLSTLFEKDSRDAASQTATDKQRFDLERKLKRSQADLQLATADLAHSKDQTTKLRQELVDSAAQTTVAKYEARRNEELVSAKQEDIIGISQREQALSDELKQVRASLEDGTKDRNRALGVAEEAERHLEDAKLAWRLQAEDLKASLKDALASAVAQEKGGGPCRKEEHKKQQPQTASAIEFPIPRETAVGATGNATLTDDVREPSIRSASDTTSQGLAGELLQRLTQETSQRRKSGKALSAKASRLWTKKLNAERRMLALAKEVMKHDKERAKKRQQHLLICQTRWRGLRHQPGSTTAANSKTRHSGRDRSLEDAKRELDSEVHKLNRFVKQLRSSKSWLDRREKKVADFETLLSADTSRSESRLEQDASSTVGSGVPLSSPESSGITDRLDSIEAMQQELDDDISDFTGGSRSASPGRAPDLRGHRKTQRGQRYSSKQGKENVLPTSVPMFSMDYTPFSPFPTASGFWGYPPHAHFEGNPGSRGRALSGSRTRRQERPLERPANRREDDCFGNRADCDSFTVHGIPGISESDLQCWLNRPDLDTRKDASSGVAARARTEHIAKLTVEGRQAQSTVALHVDWLNTLRQEMGLLGFYPPAALNAEAVSGVSAAADALIISPRRVIEARVPEARRAQGD